MQWTRPRSKLTGNTGQTVAALLIYLTLSLYVFFIGTGVLAHPSDRFLGGRADPLIQVWSLAWWPRALANSLNPFITRVVWPPTGYNLTWTTSIPGPSLALYPVTRLFGPVVSYNLLCLSCPAAAALSAFVLCRYVSRRFWPSLLGGYIFGFSPYVIAQMLGHLFLLFIFPVPLFICLVWLRLDHKISRTVFCGLFVVLLVFEFLSSVELFATTTVFGALALFCHLICNKESFREIRIVSADLLLTYAIVGVLLSPYLYYVLAYGVPAPIQPANFNSNDLLAFATPSPAVLIGRGLDPVFRQFTAGLVETAGYLGPGVWIILVLYVHAFWSTSRGKFLILCLLVTGVMSLGPIVHIGGAPISLGPWWPLSKLPLIDQALPSRFGMYFFLAAAVIVSLYVSEGPSPVWSRFVLAGLCLLFLAPNRSLFRSEGVVADATIPRFFGSQEYKRYLAKDDNVLVLPYAQTEDGLLWQVQTDFYFRLAAARFTLPPPEFSAWPVLITLDTGVEIMDFAEQFKAFLGANQVKAIIVDPRAAQPWEGLLSEAGMTPLAVDGVLFYKVPATVLTSFRTRTADEMAAREAIIAFAALISAANRYLAEGFPLTKLDPWEARRLNLLELPQGTPQASPAATNWWQNLWLGPWGDSRVGVGIVGDYQDLLPLVNKYGPGTADIFFPYPSRLADGTKSGTGQLVIVFTPQELQRAATLKSVASLPNQTPQSANR